MIRLPLRPRIYPERDVVIIGDAWVSLAAAVAFVPIERFRPAQLGSRRFILAHVKVHAAMVFVPCPYTGCGAKVGEFCRGRTGKPTIGCHVDRIDAWHRHKGFKFRKQVT